MVAVPFSSPPIAITQPQKPRAPSIAPSLGTSRSMQTIHENASTERAQLKAVTSSYRSRYAAYLAATFGISIEAATADVESALAPRKRSDVSEESVDAFKDRTIL